MGKKSIGYKKRLRRLQQLRKRATRYGQNVEKARTDVSSNPVALIEACTNVNSESDYEHDRNLQVDDELERDRTDVSSVAHIEAEESVPRCDLQLDSESEHERDAHELLKGELEEAKNKCSKLQERLDRHSRYYKSKMEVTEWKLNNAEEECAKRIRQVRSFWVAQIYKESSRPGKILKMAMQRRYS